MGARGAYRGHGEGAEADEVRAGAIGVCNAEGAGEDEENVGDEGDDGEGYCSCEEALGDDRAGAVAWRAHGEDLSCDELTLKTRRSGCLAISEIK